MKIPTFLPYLIIALLGLWGCSADYPHETCLPNRCSLGADIKTCQTPGALPVETINPTGPLTLRRALSLALLKNPALASSAWEVRVNQAEALQAGLPQNPSLEVDYYGSGISHSLGGNTSSVALSQTLDMGKRARRAKAALLEASVAGWDFEIMRLDLFTKVTKLFFEVLKSQEMVHLSVEQVRLLEQILASARKFHADTDLRNGIIKARFRLSTARIAERTTANRLVSARRQLAATWEQTTPTFDKARGSLSQISLIPSFEELARLVAKNPDVARWGKKLEQQKAALALEKAKTLPDLTITGGAERFNNDTGVIVGLSIPIPVFDRDQGNILAAWYRLNKVKAESRKAAFQAMAELSEAYDALISSHKEATALRADTLPLAESFYKTYYRAFLRSGAGLSDLLDAQQNLFETKVRYLDALTSYHKAKVEVERLAGESLETIMASRTGVKSRDAAQKSRKSGTR